MERAAAVRGWADGSSRAWYIPPVRFFDPRSASIVYCPPVPTIIFEPLHADVSVPSRATAHSAGYDLAAYLTGRTVRVFLDGVKRTTEGGGRDEFHFAEFFEAPNLRRGLHRVFVQIDDNGSTAWTFTVIR